MKKNREVLEIKNNDINNSNDIYFSANMSNSKNYYKEKLTPVIITPVKITPVRITLIQNYINIPLCHIINAM